MSDFSVSPGAVRLIEDFPLDIFTILDQQTYEDLLPRTRTTEQGIACLNRSAIINIKKKSMCDKDRIDVLALERLPDT